MSGGLLHEQEHDEEQHLLEKNTCALESTETLNKKCTEQQDDMTVSFWHRPLRASSFWHRPLKNVVSAATVASLIGFTFYFTANKTFDSPSTLTTGGFSIAPADDLPNMMNDVKHNRSHSAKKKRPECFPGEALAQVRGRGLVPVDSVQVGDEVLVQRCGQLVFEPLLGFLHKTTCDVDDGCRFVRISHKHGELRISDYHMVLARRVTTEMIGASELLPTDSVFTATTADGQISESSILGVRRDTTRRGMFAPFTASGTVVIDGVVASVYAGAPGLGRVPHSGAHAAFFLLRAYYRLALARPVAWEASLSRVDDAKLHPFASLLLNSLHLDKLIAA